MRLHREGGLQTRHYARSAKGYSQSNPEQLRFRQLSRVAERLSSSPHPQGNPFTPSSAAAPSGAYRGAHATVPANAGVGPTQGLSRAGDSSAPKMQGERRRSAKQGDLDRLPEILLACRA